MTSEPFRGCARYDRSNIKGDAVITDEGYIRANAIVTRTGVFNYRNADGSLRRELRHPDDVLHEDSISTMSMIPMTNGHPHQKLVTAENFKTLSIGFTGETIKKDGNFILANFLITDRDGVEAVTKFGRKELSLGYTVDLVDEKGIYEGEEYDARQTNIRYNHLAIVDSARAGKEARIALDSNDAEQIINNEDQMAKRRVKIDQEEVYVEPATADYIERLEEDLKNLKDERDRVQAEIDMIRDKLEKAEARDVVDIDEKDMAKEEKVEAKMDSADFKKAVASRVKLLKNASQVLPYDDVKLDDMSDLDIKKEIVLKINSNIKLDGKSEIYIDAAYETAMQMKTVNVSNVSYGAVNQDSGYDPEKARLKMMEKQKNRGK